MITTLLTAVSLLISSSQTITPGAIWRDTRGQVIQAHGGGLIKVGRSYYWFGEDKTYGGAYQHVTCYVSTDLAHWTFCGNALTRTPSGDLGPHRIIERPKVVYNRATKTFVMYMHVDDSHYREAKVGVATSKTITGPYEYLGSFRPLGHESRDMTLFQDDDGSAYLVFEDRGQDGGMRIEQLSPDYTHVDSEVALVGSRGAYEAPAITKIAGAYYLLGSHLSGWRTNPNQFSKATSLAGPWSDFRDIAPPATNTYNSQTAYVLPVYGSKSTTYIYCGDRWVPGNLSDSRYVWLPLQVNGMSICLPPDIAWTLDTTTGIASKSKASAVIASRLQLGTGTH